MPLKKKNHQRDVGNSLTVDAESNATTMTRRSSTPLIISTGTGDKSTNKKVATNNCTQVPQVLLKGEEIVSEPPGCIQSCRLKLGNVLGEGEYGFVYKGTYQVDDFKTVWNLSLVSSSKRIPYWLNNNNNNNDFRSTLPLKLFTTNIYPLTDANL